MKSLNQFKQIWDCRGYIRGSVYREVQLRYKNSLFGMGWLIINPLAMIVIYTLIFSHVMQSKISGVNNVGSYSIFLVAGIVHWGLFSEIWTKGPDMFQGNANILKKIRIPILCMPLILVFSSLINYFIVLLVLLGVMSTLGYFPGPHVVGLIVPLLIEVLIAISLAVIIGVFNVYFKDVVHISSVLIQLLFWFTPIVYSIEIIPAAVQPLLQLNPLAHVFRAYQTIFVNNAWPHWESLVYPAVFALLCLMFAVKIINSQMSDMMDEL